MHPHVFLAYCSLHSNWHPAFEYCFKKTRPSVSWENLQFLWSGCNVFTDSSAVTNRGVREIFVTAPLGTMRHTIKPLTTKMQCMLNTDIPQTNVQGCKHKTIYFNKIEQIMLIPFLLATLLPTTKYLRRYSENVPPLYSLQHYYVSPVPKHVTLMYNTNMKDLVPSMACSWT